MNLFEDVYNDVEEFEPLYLKGEYWFDEYGQSMYADGDVGDMNHEAYVIDRCAREVLGWFDIEIDEFANLDEHLNEMIDIIVDDLDIKDWDDQEQKKEELKNDPYAAIIEYLKTRTKMTGNIDDIVFIGGDHSSMDAREFAIKEWGWARVHQNNIEVKELTGDQLKRVSRGINDSLEQEGVYEEDEYLRAGKSEYNISTYTGKRYSITLDDMESGNVQGLERSDVEQKGSVNSQVRQMDVEQVPSFYKGVLGDSYKVNLFENLYDGIILESIDIKPPVGGYGFSTKNICDNRLLDEYSFTTSLGNEVLMTFYTVTFEVDIDVSNQTEFKYLSIDFTVNDHMHRQLAGKNAKRDFEILSGVIYKILEYIREHEDTLDKIEISAYKEPQNVGAHLAVDDPYNKRLSIYKRLIQKYITNDWIFSEVDSDLYLTKKKHNESI